MTSTYYLKQEERGGKTFYFHGTGIWTTNFQDAMQFPSLLDAEKALDTSIFSASAEIKEHNQDDQKN